MKRRSFISLAAIPAALALGGANVLAQPTPALAASTMPLPHGTASMFNTIREDEFYNRPTSFRFIGRKVRELRIQSRERGKPGSLQKRDSFGFRAKWQVMNDVEIFVVAEVGNYQAALNAAQKYLDSICRIPYRFRKEVKQIIIQDGKGTFRGGRGNIFGFLDQHSTFKAFQGAIFHEVLHSVDHAMSDAVRKKWKAAQAADRRQAPRFNGFVSKYAMEHPNREDFTSTVVPWFAMTTHPERLTAEQRPFLNEQIPNRMRFFDKHYSFPVLK